MDPDIEATGYQHMWVRRFISGANLVPVPKIPEAGRLATKNGGAAPLAISKLNGLCLCKYLRYLLFSCHSHCFQCEWTVV